MSVTTAAEGGSVLVEYAVRDWLRTRPELMELDEQYRNRTSNTLESRRVLSNDTRRIDLDYTGSGSYVVLYRAGGGPASTYPQDRSIITFHCYGSTRHAAALLVGGLQVALQSLNETPLNEQVHGNGAAVQSVTWLPTSDGAARYVLIALVSARRVLA